MALDKPPHLPTPLLICKIEKIPVLEPRPSQQLWGSATKLHLHLLLENSLEVGAKCQG